MNNRITHPRLRQVFAIVSRQSLQLPPPELIPLRRTAYCGGPFLLMAEDQAPFLQIIRRYFHGHSIASEGFDPVLFHFSGRVGDELMSVIELNAVTRVGQYFGYQPVKLQEFFFRHAMLL
jgi:hypothetical protein